jgi:hypothetical protein
MTLHKVRPSYGHLVQKKSLCGPACISMVLFRKGNWVDQEKLAFELGVIVNKDYKHLYNYPFKALKSPDENIGINLISFKNKKVVNLLKKYQISPEVHLISQIDDVSEFIKENIDRDVDIIANFWEEPFNNRAIGHFAIISEYDDVKKTVTILDPDFESMSYWKCPIKKLIESMSPKWTGTERGFLLIR